MNSSETVPRCAFTLVEILIVVAIIGILAGLLFTAFSRVRANSYKATCISNLRQLGLATQMYQQDYQCEKIAPNVPLHVDPIIANYARNPQILLCPLDTNRLGYGNSVLEHQISDYRNSYVYLGTYYAEQPNPDSPDRFKDTKIAGDDTAIFACQLHGEPFEDGQHWPIAKLAPHGGLVAPEQMMQLYQGTRLRLMPDGHVKTDSFIYDTVTDGRSGFSVFYALGQADF